MSACCPRLRFARTIEGARHGGVAEQRGSRRREGPRVAVCAFHRRPAARVPTVNRNSACSLLSVLPRSACVRSFVALSTNALGRRSTILIPWCHPACRISQVREAVAVFPLRIPADVPNRPPSRRLARKPGFSLLATV